MAEEIQTKLIEEQMKEAYIDYAMSVIVGRALPDVKDGLKPVHRRILYTMHQAGMQHNKPFKKSARIVGDCLGHFHPHGDVAVYDALIRMAQDFSLRYPLIDGQGNVGSIDGDPPAAQRYTEARLARIAEELLEDIDKDTVDFIPNYDNSTKEPVVLPGKIPNLLINGSTGIAVGMATNIPPHNVNEVADGVIAVIDNKDITAEELMRKIKGPDFPTGGIICGMNGIRLAYRTGRGRLVLRARTEVKDDKIIVTEIPYQVNKTSLIEEIADLVRERKIEGISDIRDESDRKGMHLVIELKKNANPDVILNQLYKNTALQTTFGVIMLALHEGQPKILDLRSMIEHFICHRKDVIIKRSRFELKKAEERVHILEGLQVAIADIDNVVALIRKAADVETARASLVRSFELTEIQASAILDMKLQRLTSLEQEKIDSERKELKGLAAKLREILGSEQKVLGIIKDELFDIKNRYGDGRRTEILDVEEEIDDEALIEDEDVVVVMSYTGYIKKMPIDVYRKQKRGGKGVVGAYIKEDDIVRYIFTTSSHNHILCFSNAGRVYWLKAYKIPTASRYSRGRAIVNLLKLGRNERVNALIPISKFSKENYLLMATRKGMVKKTKLSAYSRPRKGGIKGIKLREDDELVSVRVTPGSLDMILGTKKGLAVKFNETDVRVMGRNSTGVRGVRLSKDDEVVGMEVALSNGTLLTVTENGYGKRSGMKDYRLIRRGGKGVISIKTNNRNGKVIGIKTVMDRDEVILVTSKGITIRIPVSDIHVIGRNTQGVRIMRLNSGDKVATVARVIVR